MRDNIKEEHVIVLDFLPNGYPFDTRPLHLKTAIAQAIGKQHLVLLELVPKKGIYLQPHQEVYIGEGKRDEIHHIIGRIHPSKLTQTAKAELNYVIDLKDRVKLLPDPEKIIMKRIMLELEGNEKINLFIKD